MRDIVRRTTIGALLLLFMPLTVWVTGWRWTPGNDGFVLKMLFWITETVTSPWGTLTSIVLSLWFLWCLRFRLNPALGIAAIVLVTVLIGQGVKSLMNEWLQEPRPYVVWLEQQHQVEESYFYSLSRRDRGALVESQLRDAPQIPHWLRRHWQAETGFSFPSGHTMFAAVWTLLGVGLLWGRRHYRTVAVLMVWAAGVMDSRLVLGMHWPQDLIVSTLIGWLLTIVACWLAQKWCGSLSVGPEEVR